MIDGKYEYFAFISYQRNDELWADRLRRKLEHYHLPSSVRKQNVSLPKEIRPIFRDALELSGGVLAKEIETALRKSKFLIVICSPNSAKSPWVNKEVQTFINLGREENIIPFIINGSPFSNSEDTECFPPALSSLNGDKELLGININELSRDASFVKVVARMFGLKFDTLWQRYERGKRLRNAIIATVISAFVIMITCVAGYVLKKNWDLMKIQAQVVSKTANSLTFSGDSYTARMLLLDVLPNDMGTPNRPYTPEAEFALRSAFESNYAKISTQYPVHRVQYSLDDEFVIFSNGWNILLLDTKNGEISDVGWTHYSTITSIAISKDGRFVVSASGNDETFSDIFDYSIKIWDFQTKKIYREINNLNSAIIDVAFSPDNKFLTASFENGELMIWEVESSNIINKIEQQSNPVKHLSYSNNGNYIVSASDDGKIIVWDAQNGMMKNKIDAHDDKISSVIVSLDSKKIISASYDCTIKIWDLLTGKFEKGFTNLNTNNDKGEEITSMSLNYDGTKIAFASNGDNVVKIFNLNTDSIYWQYYGHESTITSVCFSNKGEKIVSASMDYSIRLYDESRNEKCHIIDGHLKAVSSVCYSSSGNSFLSASYDNSIRIWDSKSKQNLYIYRSKMPITSACFSPSGEDVLFSSYKNAYIWNPKQNKLKRRFKCSDIVYSASYNESGDKVITASADDSIKIWDINNGKVICQIEEITPHVTSALFSPNDKRIAISCFTTVHIWDADLGEWWNEEMHESWPIVFDGHRETVLSASFNPNNKEVVSGSQDGVIYVSDAKTGNRIFTLNGHDWSHTADINSVSYSRDGKYILSASEDERVNVWDAKTGEIVQSYKLDAPVWCASFSPDSKQIIIGMSNGKIAIWDFPPLQELIDSTRERFKNRQLTSEERKQYYLE